MRERQGASERPPDDEAPAGVTVRPASPGDAAAIEAAHVAAIERCGPAAYDEEAVAAWAERPDGAEPYREQAAADDGEVFVVAEVDGSVAGFGHLVPPGEREDADAAEPAEVVAVYVHGDHARRGVGTALLDHLEAAARERGAGALVLTASLNAVGFYERHGYERVREAVHETTGGVELDVLDMRKDLDAA